MKPAGPAEEKVELLEQKLHDQAKLYRVLIGLARKQTAEIAHHDIDPFLLIQEEKRQIIERIGEIESATAPLREFWENHKEEVGAEKRDQLRAVVQEIRTLLEELLELEAHSQNELGLARDALGAEIRHLSVGKKAMRSYGRPPDDRPRFMDENG